MCSDVHDSWNTLEYGPAFDYVMWSDHHLINHSNTAPATVQIDNVLKALVPFRIKKRTKLGSESFRGNRLI